jgi:hypothetical protein
MGCTRHQNRAITTTGGWSPIRASPKRRFLRFLNQSLSAVVVGPIWTVSPTLDDSGAFIARTNPVEVALRTSGGGRLYLRSIIRFSYGEHPKFTGERKVFTHEYAHTVGADQSLKPQLYSWEWNTAEPTYPHVHVRRSDPQHKGLGKLHIPTGRVFFEDVLLFLIKEHDVEPQGDNWRMKLSDSLHRVSTYASWGGGVAP